MILGGEKGPGGGRCEESVMWQAAASIVHTHTRDTYTIYLE